MKKSTLRHLLSVACLTVCATVQAQENFYQFKEIDKNVKATSMSPNGKYVVGIDYISKHYGNTFMTGYSSFLWNVEKATQEWMTLADETQLEKTGSFYDVNDNGVAVGCFKDTLYQITTTLDGVSATRPVNTAAVWTNGKVESLGIGNDLQLAHCKRFTDGTVATAISNDGKTIAGNYVENDNAYPCVWKLDDKGHWNYQSLPLTEEGGLEATKGSVTDISADGRIIVGSIYEPTTFCYLPAYWVDNQLHVIFAKHEDKDFTGRNSVSKAMSVSANGEYISLQFKKKNLAVYSVSKKSYVRTESVFGASALEYAPIADNGNVMPTFVCGRVMDGGVYYRPMMYSYADGTLVDFSYFLKVYASQVDFPMAVEPEEKPAVYVLSLTTDGFTLLGNEEKPDPANPINKFCSAWMLKASTDNVKLPAVPGQPRAKLTAMNQVTFNWKAVHDQNYQLKSYRIYQNGKLAGEVANDGALENYEYVVTKSQRGYVNCAVSAVYENEKGETLESPKSAPTVVAVPYSDAKWLFEDFERDKWKKNLWTFSTEVENDEVADTWGCLEYHGLEGSSAGLTVSYRTNHPYSLSAISIPVNATTLQGNIHFAMAACKRLFGNTTDDLTHDSLSLDISTDWGNTWEEAKSWTGADFSNQYGFESVDITPWVKGKIFQIRLRSHGQGAAPVQFLIDHLSVKEETAYAPAGLLAIEGENNSRMLRWKNNYGAYEVNYFCSPYDCLGGKTIGNNGKEIIGANLYDAQMLAPFNGKYLTTVTTILNWYKEGGRPQMDASILIWEDDVLVREQSFPARTFNQYVVVKLDEPLLIDAGKNIKIGVKVSNYPENQLPLLYFASNDYVNGKSNLYSEDGGNTWSTLKEAFASSEQPSDGYGIWRISAGISDESSITLDPRDRNPLLAFNVYRDGKKLNDQIIYYLQGRLLEKDVRDGGSYEVRGYYEKGGVSHLSEAFSFVPTGIENQMTEEGVVYNPETRTLSLQTPHATATVYTVNGKKIAETRQPQLNLCHLTKGVYIIKVKDENGNRSFKLLIE